MIIYSYVTFVIVDYLSEIMLTMFGICVNRICLTNYHSNWI